MLLGVAIALAVVVPVRFVPPSAVQIPVGLLLLVTGTMLWLWGRWTLARRHTSSHPTHAPSALLDVGPYRFSRNPTYLGLVVVFLGAAVAFDAAWLLAFTAAEFLLADLQVRREESYLESRFGQAYIDYRSRVRRWL
jgi:protein-S-isoprenylcysteine O-methyltransferase Ste14